jgi:hypothetical protein
MKKDKFKKLDERKADDFRHRGEMKAMMKEQNETIRNNILFVSTNAGKDKTCGSCVHSDNDLGFVALHCMELCKEAESKNARDPEFETCDYDKVRSWYKCKFKPSRYKAQKKNRGRDDEP